MNEAEIRVVAEEILRPRLADFKFERADIWTGTDNSDEPAIYIYAVLGPDAPDLGQTTLMDAGYALSRELLARGETRLPYLRTRRLDDDDRAEVGGSTPSPDHA